MKCHSAISDDRGAIMIIALCFAVFGVAILYLAVGAAESVLFREHLQDAADSAALSGAITNARIMNVLVLINMVMVALLAILVTLKLVEGIAIVGMAIAAGLAWCTFGASLVAIPPLSALRTSMSTIYDSVKPLVFNALELLHTAGDGMAQAAPYIAEGMAQGDIVGKDDGIDANGFGASTAKTLPIEDDTYDGLCGKAGTLAWKIANIPLQVIPGWSVISGALDGPMHAITESLSDWFCGDSGGGPPDLGQNVDRGYPRTAQAVKCESYEAPEESYIAGQEKDATNNECNMAEQERVAATPDAQGNCVGSCDPVVFESVVGKARADCDPGRAPTPTKYRYQTQDGKVDYKWDGTQWVRGEPEFYNSSANLAAGEESDSLPCAAKLPEGLFRLPNETPCGPLTTARYYEGYNKTIRSESAANRVLPVCTNECGPKEPPPDTEKNPSRTVTFRQITHVFSCSRHERQDVDVRLPKQSPNEEGKKDGNKKSPKKIAAGTTLGGEEFQVRAVVVADPAQQASATAVRLSLWGRGDPSDPTASLRKLGGFSFAQAEYYYSGSLNEEWLWNMKWRGRLRHFRMPTIDESKKNLRDACERWQSINCDKYLSLVDTWKDLLLH